MTPDLRRAYREHQAHVREQLELARRRRVEVRLATGLFWPSEWTDHRIDDRALRDAEHVMNIATNQHADA